MQKELIGPIAGGDEDLECVIGDRGLEMKYKGEDARGIRCYIQCGVECMEFIVQSMEYRLGVTLA